MKSGLPAINQTQFQFIALRALYALWWGVWIEKSLPPLSLAVYFAAQEAQARRCALADDEPRAYTLNELQELIGKRYSKKKIAAALLALQAAGLIRWSSSESTFAEKLGKLRLERTEEFWEVAGALSDRTIPVPRAVIRLIAAGARPVLVATILGHLFWCVFRRYRQKKTKCDGCVSAAALATLFRVSTDNVHKARRQLVALGLIRPLPQDWRHRQRRGTYVCFDVTWSRPGRTHDTPRAAAELPVQRTFPPTRQAENASFPPTRQPEKPPIRPTPYEDRDPEINTQNQDKHQDLAGGEPAGVFKAPEKSRKNLPKPTLSNLIPDDLIDIRRLLILYEQAATWRWFAPSDYTRLSFLAAAEHARVAGSEPVRLFRYLVQHQKWDYLTQDDEDAAKVRLYRHLYGARYFTETA